MGGAECHAQAALAGRAHGPVTGRSEVMRRMGHRHVRTALLRPRDGMVDDDSRDDLAQAVTPIPETRAGSIAHACRPGNRVDGARPDSVDVGVQAGNPMACDAADIGPYQVRDYQRRVLVGNSGGAQDLQRPTVQISVADLHSGATNLLSIVRHAIAEDRCTNRARWSTLKSCYRSSASRTSRSRSRCAAGVCSPAVEIDRCDAPNPRHIS